MDGLALVASSLAGMAPMRISTLLRYTLRSGLAKGGSQSQIGVAVINWLLEGPQQNHYVSRKGLGALTKKNPVPHLEFYYFGFQMENNFQKHNFVVARLCEPMRFPDVP